MKTITFQFVSAPITKRGKKLKGKWTCELEQKLHVEVNPKTEKLLKRYLETELNKELYETVVISCPEEKRPTKKKKPIKKVNKGWKNSERCRKQKKKTL